MAADDVHEVAELVPMPHLLEALAIEANTRTRRAACILHGGSNPTAFSWREDGRWRCFSCGASGDRIALVRAVQQCGFREAVAFLAHLAGVSYEPQRVSRRQIEAAKRQRQRADAAAWRVRDEVLRLRFYYRDGLHRAERLWRRFGDELLRARSGRERDAVWYRMARLAPACTFFLAGFRYINDSDSATLVSFALASPAQRREAMLGDDNADAPFRAA